MHCQPNCVLGVSMLAGGTLVIACWCQREDTPENPLTDKDKADLQFLYDEWAHPYFISYQEFARFMQVRVCVCMCVCVCVCVCV